VGDSRVISDLGGNKYRLVVHVSFTFGHALKKFIGTHAEYDRIDPETVSWPKMFRPFRSEADHDAALEEIERYLENEMTRTRLRPRPIILTAPHWSSRTTSAGAGRSNCPTRSMRSATAWRRAATLKPILAACSPRPSARPTSSPISLVFVAAGIGMLIFEPHKWLVTLASTAFFVVCAVVAVRMIVLRRRAVGGRS
jgi:hypothetical protein